MLKSSQDFNRLLFVYDLNKYVRFGSSFAKVFKKEIYEMKLLVKADDVLNIEVDSLFSIVREFRKNRIMLFEQFKA